MQQLKLIRDEPLKPCNLVRYFLLCLTVYLHIASWLPAKTKEKVFVFLALPFFQSSFTKLTKLPIPPLNEFIIILDGTQDWTRECNCQKLNHRCFMFSFCFTFSPWLENLSAIHAHERENRCKTETQNICWKNAFFIMLVSLFCSFL